MGQDKVVQEAKEKWDEIKRNQTSNTKAITHNLPQVGLCQFLKHGSAIAAALVTNNHQHCFHHKSKTQYPESGYEQYLTTSQPLSKNKEKTMYV